jgi:hypothetical protein
MIVTGASLRGRVGGQRRQGHAPAGTVPDSVDLQGPLMPYQFSIKYNNLSKNFHTMMP